MPRGARGKDKEEREERPPEKVKKPGLPEEKASEFRDRLKNLFKKKYYKQLVKAANEDQPFVMDYGVLDRFGPDLGDLLISMPEIFFELASAALDEMDLPGPVKLRVANLPEAVMIRDLRSKHIGRFICTEGIVRKASEIRPEVVAIVWECPACGEKIEIERRGTFIGKPFECACGNKKGFKEFEKKLVDTRWMVIEEPFELTEGERPSQVTVLLTEDLVNPEGRHLTEPGNRLKMVGILKDVPKGKLFSVKLDFYLETNHFEPTEIGWERIKISKEDEKKIKEVAKDPKAYDMLVGSLAPSLYGLKEVKEAIILQLFGGVPRTMKDKTKFRGDVHLLIIGDPSSGKSQLLQLVPQIVPRGKYVSGKGVTGAGLCTTYDSLIQLDNGNFVKIGDLVEKQLKNNCKEVQPGIFVAKKPNKTKILSLEKEKIKLKPFSTVQFWKLRAPKKLAELVTRTGRKITVTMDNPVLVLKDGKLVWKKAKELTESDFIACARNLLGSKRKPTTFSLIEESSRVLNASDLIGYFVSKVKEKTTIRDFAGNIGIDENKLYHFWRDGDCAGKPKMVHLKSICSALDLDPVSVFPEQITLSQYNGHKITLPKEFNEDLMYLVGLIAGDGSISKTKFGGFDIKFSNNDERLLDKFSKICSQQIGIKPRYEKSRDRIPNLRFRSKILAGMLEKLGVPSGKKSHKIHVTEYLSSLPNNLIASYLQGLFDADGCVVLRKTRGSSHIELDSVSEEFIRGIQLILLKFGIIGKARKRGARYSEIKGRPVISGPKWALEITGLENISLFKENIGFRFPEKQSKLEFVMNDIRASNTNIDIIPEVGNVLRKARSAAGLSAKELYGYNGSSYEKMRRKPSRDQLKKIVSAIHVDSEQRSLLAKLADSDILWDKVKSVKLIDNKKHEYVYDVTIEGEHSFVCNGIVIHNTATVTKDEQFMGGWVLEAGAMVLANKGLLAVDEFEKMSPEDQVAMHEALSLGSVSIAKASIVATLPAQTSLLAGGNPKFSRFDPYMPIVKQIQIPDTLLSRFDLKFVLRDIPDTKEDTKIVEHILSSREEDYEGALPKLDSQFIRKYITYAKRNCDPTLPKEVGEMMKKFYVETRRKAQREGGAIPITLRQFEALVRLAEASAKIQLSPTVRKKDAQRAIRLMRFSLEQLGLVSETGEIDVDKFEGALTTSKDRSSIRVVLDIINELSRTKKEILQNEVVEEAKKQGVDDAEEVIDRLKREGMLFEPSPGYIQKV